MLERNLMKIYTFYIALLCCFFSFIEAYTIRLPEQLRNYAMFHIERRPIEDINGCFRALFDACNIEEICGIPNTYSDYTTFFDNFRKKKINYQALGVVVNTMPELAKRHLEIDVFCIDSYGRLTDIPFPKGLGQGVSAEESAHIIGQTILENDERCKKKIQALLDNEKKERIAIHFLHATGSSVTLMSLIKTNQGKVIYVFNPQNKPLGLRFFGMFYPCSSMQALSKLASDYDLGTREDFQKTNDLKNIWFPAQWPSIPQTYSEIVFEYLDPLITLGKAVGTIGGFGVSCYGLWKLWGKIKR